MVNTVRNFLIKLNNLPQMCLQLRLLTCTYKLRKTNSKKTAEPTGNLNSNKTANKIRKVSRNPPQNNSGMVTNEAENIGL